MTTTPPEGTAPQAAAEADARATVLGWARRTIDLIPTSWLITGTGAVLLATTAAFGGLTSVPVPPTPEVAVGEAHAGSDLEMTVVGVTLSDERGNALVFPDEEKGERVLAVELDVVNTFTSTRSAPGALEGFGIGGIDTAPSISRADDGAGSLLLQPGVRAPLLLAWIVGPDDFHDGETVTVTLPDSTRNVGKVFVSGEYWNDFRVGALVTATVEEVTTP